MRILVTGAAGMLGRDLADEIKSRGHEAAVTDLPELDIADPSSVAQISAGQIADGCSWCINCAAYTAVDKAETEPDKAALVNAIGPGYLAAACQMKGIRLLHVSTDFVFDGAKASPYTEDDVTNPLGVYGSSKLMGEEAVRHHQPNAVIVRTSWLFGPHGESFPRTMLRAFLAGKKLRVVDDQIGTPTYTAELARVSIDIAERDISGGIYHSAGPTPMTRHEFASCSIECYIRAQRSDLEIPQIEVAQSSEFPTAAKRPAYSALSMQKLNDLGIPSMQSAEASLFAFCKRLGADP